MIGRVVLGSDDDDEYDELSSGDEAGETTFVDGEDGSGFEQDVEFQEMMESSPEDARSGTRGLQMTDLTEDMTLDSIIESKMTKRSRTTMEELGSASNRGHSIFNVSTKTSDSRGLGGSNGDPSLAISREEPMPSSREIYAVGETEVQTPGESFRTQTTLPFTHPEQDDGAPTAFVPTTYIQSSAGLANDIDGIHEFLQQDIANTAALQNEVDTDLPSTESMGPSHKDTAVSQPESLHSIHSPRSDPKKSKRRFEDDDEPVYDDMGIVIPAEMYKPRPSRSRAKRSADDLDLHTSSKQPRGGDKDDRKIKRRRTDGDAMEEVLSRQDRSNPRPLEIRSSQHEDADEDRIEGHRSEMPEAPAEVEQQSSQPRSKQGKKKRGRPKKSASKESKKEERVEAASNDDKHHNEGRDSRPKPRASKVIVLDDSEDELAGDRPVRKSSDSENNQATRDDPQANETPAGEDQQTTAKQEAPPAKKAAKRGRKPKKSQSKVEQAEEENSVAQHGEDGGHANTDAEAGANAQGIEVNQESNVIDEAASSPLKRKPLRDKSNSGNIPVSAGGDDPDKVDESEAKQVETPQKPAGSAVSRPSPASNGKVPHRVGLSKRHRIEPLLKVIRRK